MGESCRAHVEAFELIGQLLAISASKTGNLIKRANRPVIAEAQLDDVTGPKTAVKFTRCLPSGQEKYFDEVARKSLSSGVFCPRRSKMFIASKYTPLSLR